MDAKANRALNHAQNECNEMKLHTIQADRLPLSRGFARFQGLSGVAHRLLSCFQAAPAIGDASKGDVP
jgi:hypothetical protein